MSAIEQHYDGLVPDDELRPHLETNRIVVFRNAARNWREIERQVERLGYDKKYRVLAISTEEGQLCRLVPQQ